MAGRVRNSIGIWAFGANATRFVPSGYHPEADAESMVDRTRRVCEGLNDLLDGVEYHYPGEINEDNADAILDVLREHGMSLPIVASGLHPDPTYALGSIVNPDPKLRAAAIATNKRGVDLAADLGAHFIVWPGSEGYNYPFQRDYAKTWSQFIDGIAEITDHARGRGVRVYLEHKNSEPAMKVLLRNIGMALYLIAKVRESGVETSNLLINMDWQHLIMNGENLAEYAQILSLEGRLGHQHANDGWGTFDDDNVVGTNFVVQTIELLATLQDVGYGSQGELMGYDLYPYTENQVEAARAAILHLEFLWDIAGAVNRRDLDEARQRADALGGQRAVYQALGLTPEREREIIESRGRIR